MDVRTCNKGFGSFTSESVLQMLQGNGCVEPWEWYSLLMRSHFPLVTEETTFELGLKDFSA